MDAYDKDYTQIAYQNYFTKPVCDYSHIQPYALYESHLE